MAQERHSTGPEGRRHNARRTLERAGLAQRRKVVAACIAIALVLAVCSVGAATRSAGIVVSRDGEQSQADGSGTEAVEEGETSSGRDSEGSSATSAEQEGQDGGDSAAPTVLVVHVDGAVASPGVYTITKSPARVVDAVEAAGGLLPEADTSSLNLAAGLEDGTKVHVPTAGEASAGQSAGGGSDAAGTATAATSGAASAQSGTAASGKVNINTATAEELTALPGVGDSTAQAIVEDRQNNGRFTSPEDIMRVSGIGEKKFAKMKDRICV